MSDRMPVGPALEQLRELIAILRELSNAGPRDNSFKQWRQVTLTLLQRLWPGDQTRAVRFRRIPFSAPSSRADAKTTRECYERGVCEAIAFLEHLVLELEADPAAPRRPLVRPPEAVARPSRDGRAHETPALDPSPSPSQASRPAQPDGAVEPAPRPTPTAPVEPPARVIPPRSPHVEPTARFTPPPPAEPLEPSLWNPPPPEPHKAPVVHAPPSEVAPPPSAEQDPPAPAKPGAVKVRARPRQRLKDMLGFGDEEATRAKPVEPPSPIPSTTSWPPVPVSNVSDSPAASPPSMPEAAPPPATVTPVESRWAPLAPVIPLPSPTPRDPEPDAPAGPGAAFPPPVAEPVFDDEESDVGFDLADDAGPEAELPPPVTLREMLERDPAPRPAGRSQSAREVLSMADRVDQLGVPQQRRAIVRAALVDLGHQLDAPPVHWSTIRQALTFMMDYPQIARRVIPLLMPYLDEAA